MLCAITANAARCRGGRLLPLQPRSASSIASLLHPTRSSARASCAKLAVPESSSPSFLAWAKQRSRAAWIAQLYSAFNDAV